MIEWFLPGTEPQREDDWQRNRRTALPPEYAEWAAAADRRLAIAADATSDGPVRAEQEFAYRIVSPQDGDRYEVPPRMDARFATLPLTAVGGRDEEVSWFVDGRPVSGTRWRLEPGAHIVRAMWSSGRADSVRIVVDPPLSLR